MKPLGTHNYLVYIVTNQNRSVLYIGVTNNLKTRLYQHQLDSQTTKLHFASKYNTIYLIYWERFQFIDHAIKREKQLKGWTRIRKDQMIKEFNPELRFLNDEAG